MASSGKDPTEQTETSLPIRIDVASKNLPRSPFAMPDGVVEGLAKASGLGGVTAVNLEASLTPPPMLSPTSSQHHQQRISRSTSRLSLPLEFALGSMERPDGAREARTLLPGVDLRHFNLSLGGEEQDWTDGEDLGGKGAPDMDGLRVIQTPKGISLREAIWEADAIQRQPNTAQPGGSISPTGFLFQSLPSPSEKQAQHQHQQPPMSPWEALISNLATAEGSSVTVPWTTTQSEGAQQAQQESDLLGGIRPSSAAFRTPPTVPALHAAPAPPTSTAQGTLATRFSLPPLQLPTEVTDATLAESHSSPSPLGLLHSPAPLLTPGAPPSVPLELRAEAAERLWPLLAPFAPRILRDDILRPAEQRRFVRPAEKSGYFGRRSGDPELSSTPSAPWLPSGLRMDSEMEPEACTFQAAVAVADVSGFTALTEVLSRAGPSGVELLTRCMNSYFAQVIDVVTQHGGDVVKFAGDAIIIVFEPTKEETETGEDGGLAAATRRAAAASLELIDKYGVMSMQPTGVAVPVPRDQVARDGSRFIRLDPPQKEEDSVPSTPSFVSAAASPFVQIAKKGSAVARAAVTYAGIRPLASGSKALSGLIRMGESRNTKNKEVWMDWLEEDKEMKQEKVPSSTKKFTKFGRGPRITTSAQPYYRSMSDSDAKVTPERHLPKRKGASASELALAPQSSMALAKTPATQVIRSRSDASPLLHSMDFADQAQVVRAIHEQTLESFATEFGGDGVFQSRAPELPHSRSAAREPMSVPKFPRIRRGFHATSSALGSSRIASRSISNTGAAAPDPGSFSGRSEGSFGAPPSRTGSAASINSAGAAGDSIQTSFSLFSGFGRITSSSFGFNNYSNTARKGSGSALARAPLPVTSVRNAVAGAFGQLRSDISSAANSMFLPPLRMDSVSSPRPGLGGVESPSEDLQPAPLNRRISHSAPVSPQNSPPGSPRRAAHSHSEALSPKSGARTPSPTPKEAPSSPPPAPPSLQRPSTGGNSANELLSLKVMLGAGTICAFRVGGVMESTTSGNPDAARWEFFVADVEESSESNTSTSTNSTTTGTTVGVESENPSHCSNGGTAKVESGDLCEDPSKKSSSAGSDVETDDKVESTPFALQDSSVPFPLPPPRGPIAQLKATEHSALTGSVVISKEAAALVGTGAEMAILPDGSAHLVALTAPMTEKEEEIGCNEAVAGVTLDMECSRLAELPFQERVNAYQLLRSHVPFNVRLRVEAGHIDSVNEVRVCTTVFLGFPSLGSTTGEAVTSANLAAVQTATQIAQGRMHQDGGLLLQMRCDEKGFLAVCAFGLPGRVHEDSPARGIKAALAVVKSLHRQGHAAVAGVTTGSLFCGVVGSSKRAEYTVFGDAINLAARLMVKASRDPEMGPVLCDESTRWMAAGEAEFHALEPMHVKGRGIALRVFQASSLEDYDNDSQGDDGQQPPALPRMLISRKEHEHSYATARKTLSNGGSVWDAGRGSGKFGSEEEVSAETPLIGREKEMAIAGKRLASLVDGRGGGAVFIEGDTGMGKTRLAEEIAWGQSLAPLRDRCVVVASAGKAMRQSEPFYPWRQIFRQVFEVDLQRSAERNARAGEPANLTDGGAAPLSDLAKRLADRVPDYAVWRPSLAMALGVKEDEMPPIVASSLSTFSRGMAVDAVSQDGATLRVPRAVTFSFHPGRGPKFEEEQEKGKEIEDEGQVVSRETSWRHSSTSQDSEIRGCFRSVSDRTLNPGRPASAGGASPSRLNSSSGGAGPGPSDMSYALRGVKIRALLVAILREFCVVHTPLLIVLDDLHLFDGASWRTMLDALAALSKEVLLVGTLRNLLSVSMNHGGSSETVNKTAANVAFGEGDSSRPSSRPGSPDRAAAPISNLTFTPRGSKMVPGPALLGPEHVFARSLGEYYEDALWHSHSERIPLHRFTLEETQAYLSMALGGAEVSRDAAHVLWTKSAGMPAYLHQVTLFLQLRAKGMLGHDTFGGATTSATENSPLAIARSILEFVRATVNIHAAVSERMDALTPDEQYTLKVASVMGNTVYSDLLEAAHPQGLSSRRISAHLRALRDAGFLTKVKDEGSRRTIGPGKGDTWQFVDVLALDAVYALIPALQRSQMHVALAKGMVRMSDGDDGTAPGDGTSSVQKEGLGGKSWEDGLTGSNHHPWRRAIPAAIIAYHWTHAFLEGEATQRDLGIEAISWWERAATDAVQVQGYDEELSLLYNAATIADDIVALEMNNPLLDKSQTVTLWRRARWERCASAALMTGPDKEAVTVEDAVIHALISLKMLDVPMPWSEEYRQGGSALGKLVQRMTGRGRGSYQGSGEGLGQFFGFKDAFMASNYGTFASLELCERSGVPVEDCERVAAVCMLALTLPALTQLCDAKSLEYIVWLCGYLAGGRKRIKRGSTLYAVMKRVQELLRSADKKKGEMGLIETLEGAVTTQREHGPFRSALQAAKESTAQSSLKFVGSGRPVLPSNTPYKG